VGKGGGIVGRGRGREGRAGERGRGWEGRGGEGRGEEMVKLRPPFSNSWIRPWQRIS